MEPSSPLSVRSQAARGAAWLVVGRVGGQALSLARNIVVARLIGPQHSGVAATFAFTPALLEALTTVSPDRLLVQAPDGHEAPFQWTAQAIQALRGAILGAVLLGLSSTLASLFNTPEALWAYQLMALVPVLHGLAHLDPQRVQREMNFALDTKVELLTQASLLALAVPVAASLRDYGAAAWITLLGAALSASLTHVLARRHYRWAWDPQYARRIMVFGWPLLINGLLLFLILRGDDFIIGSAPRLLGVQYTKDDLGQFAAAASLALAVEMAGAAVTTPLFLQLFSAVQHSPEAFTRRYGLCIGALAAAAATIGAGGVLAAPALFALLLGNAYQRAGTVFPWLIAMQMLRLVRVAPTLAAMARADTQATMLTNLVRVLGFAATLVAATHAAAIERLALFALAAEVLACGAAVLRLEARQPVGWLESLRPIGLVLAVLGVALGVAHSQRDVQVDHFSRLATGGLAALLAAGTAALAQPPLRAELAYYARTLRRVTA